MVSYVGFKAQDMGFDAHLTVCYFGDNATEEILTEIKEIISLPVFKGHTFVRRHELAFFGPQNDIPVLKVIPPGYLYDLRSRLKPFSVSEFDLWNPHITLKLNHPYRVILPEVIKLTDLGIY